MSFTTKLTKNTKKRERSSFVNFAFFVVNLQR